MGCDCCKQVNPADYAKCQKDMDIISRSKNPTSSKRDILLLVVSHLRLVQSLQCPRRRENVRDRQYDSTRAREIKRALYL